MSDHKLSRLAQSIIPLLILAAIFIYLPPYAQSFIGDDYVQLDYILRFVERSAAVFQIFHPYEIGWYYRPLQNLWFLVNRVIFGYQPFGYYWLQLLVHGLVIAALYRLGRQAGLRPLAAVVPAALFAIHSHHMDVVAWISAIAIVLAAFLTLATMSAYLAYRKRPSRFLLALVLIAFLFTLLTHEEAILLPPLLLLWPWLGAVQREKGWRWPNLRRGETAVLATTFLLAAAYVAIQFLRPNPTLQPQDTPWLQLLHPNQWTTFAAQTVDKLLPIQGVAEFLLPQSYVTTFLLALLLGWALWRGNRLIRWGIVWTLLHLAFIYVALWSQKPELYAGRHIYNAGLGLVLALGGATQLVVPELKTTRRWQTPPSPHFIGLLLLLTAVLMGGVRITRIHQSAWATKAAEDQAAKAQVQQLIPAVDDDTHLFAHRFPITPRFLRSVIQVWYRREARLKDPFGPLDELVEHGRADPDFFLLDYDAEGNVYNLMPELQEHAETILLWGDEPVVARRDESGAIVETIDEETDRLSLAGPPEARRLALTTEPPAENWLSLAYTRRIPEESDFRFAIRYPAESGQMTFRILLQRVGETVLLYEQTLPAASNAWQTVTIPMEGYGGETATVRLEVKGGEGAAYWANPRFTRH